MSTLTKKITSILKIFLLMFLFVLLLDIGGDFLKVVLGGYRISLRVLLLVCLCILSFFHSIINYHIIKNNRYCVFSFFFIIYAFVLFRIGEIEYGFINSFNIAKVIVPIPFILYAYLIADFSKKTCTILKRFFYFLTSLISIVTIALFIIWKTNAFGITNVFESAQKINSFLGCRVFIPRLNGGGVFSPYQTVIVASVMLSFYELLFKRRIMVLPFFIINTICIIQSMTRTYYLCLFVFMLSNLFLFFCGLFKKETNKKKALLWFFTICIIVLLVTLFVILFGFRRFSSINEPGTSKRIEDFFFSINSLGSLKVLFGYGFGFYKYGLGYDNIEIEPVQLFVEIGVVGFILFLFIIIYWFKTVNCVLENNSLVLVFFFVSFLIGSFFNPILLNPNGIGLFGIIFYSLRYDEPLKNAKWNWESIQ